MVHLSSIVFPSFSFEHLFNPHATHCDTSEWPVHFPYELHRNSATCRVLITGNPKLLGHPWADFQIFLRKCRFVIRQEQHFWAAQNSQSFTRNTPIMARYGLLSTFWSRKLGKSPGNGHHLAIMYVFLVNDFEFWDAQKCCSCLMTNLHFRRKILKIDPRVPK